MPVSPKPVEPPKPPSTAGEFARHLQAAEALEKKQNYAAAVASYQEALKHKPREEKAIRGVAFCTHMAAGQTALKQMRHADAVRSLEAALKVNPGHAEATALLKQAREKK